MVKPLRILHLEDEPDFVELVKAILEKDGLAADIVLVKDLEEFVAALDKGGFDIILADYRLPSCTGIEALREARQRCPDTPFVLVSGTIGEAGGNRGDEVRGDGLRAQAMAGAAGAGGAAGGAGGARASRRGGRPRWNCAAAKAIAGRDGKLTGRALHPQP